MQIKDEKLVEIQENLHFFCAEYGNEEIKISHEHTDFKFFEKKDLDPKEKFQRVALKALEMKR